MLTGREILFAPVHVQQTMATGDSSRVLSASLKLVAFGFVALDTQLASIDLRVGLISGSPVCNAYLIANDPTNNQDSPLVTPITSALATISGQALNLGVNTLTWPAHTLSPEEKYWVMLRHVSGTSAGLYYLNGANFNQTIGGAGRVGKQNFLKMESATDAESVSWSTPIAINPLGNIRQVYTSGKTFGFLGASGSNAYNTIRHRAETPGEDKGVGQAYIVPQGMRLNLKGFLMAPRAAATVASDVEFFAECYINRALVAISLPCYSGDVYTVGNNPLYFEFAQTIRVPDGCELLILVRCKYHPDAYYYYTTRLSLLDAYADEYMPQPIRRAAYFSNDGSGITVDQSSVTSCALLLDADEPFYAPPINRRTSTGR